MHSNKQQKGTTLSKMADKSVHDVAVTEKETYEQRNNREILKTLAELGGGQLTEESVIFQGTKFVLPEGTTKMDGLMFLQQSIDADEETHNFVKQFKYRPWDGAYCTYNALKRVFGSVVSKSTMGFFGPNPPSLITIPDSATSTVSVPWGDMEIPILPGARISLGSYHHHDYGMLFEITVFAALKHKHQVEGLFVVIEDELRKRSLYRGKAIDSTEQAEFLDLTGVDRDKIVYTDDTWQQLDANIIAQIRDPARHKKYGLPTKRSALLHGDYGTGKTLAAYLVAQECEKAGRTFIMVRAGKDDLEYALQTARLYQPACVFFEDLDTLVDPSSGVSVDSVSRMLDVFDGISAKGTDIIALMTTNHTDRIVKGMLRPGRLDAVIKFGALDTKGIQKLIMQCVPKKMLSSKVDWPVVAKAMDGFMPAFVREASDRALRYALVRVDEDATVVLDTEDFVNAANGLRDHQDLMTDASEHQSSDQLGDAFIKMTEGVVKRTVIDSGGNPLPLRVTDE